MDKLTWWEHSDEMVAYLRARGLNIFPNGYSCNGNSLYFRFGSGDKWHTLRFSDHAPADPRNVNSNALPCDFNFIAPFKEWHLEETWDKLLRVCGAANG